jgi:hypothetical protein
MSPRLLMAELLAAELVELKDNERAALNHLISAGFAPEQVTQQIALLLSLARDLRAAIADQQTGEAA